VMLHSFDGNSNRAKVWKFIASSFCGENVL